MKHIEKTSMKIGTLVRAKHNEISFFVPYVCFCRSCKGTDFGIDNVDVDTHSVGIIVKNPAAWSVVDAAGGLSTIKIGRAEVCVLFAGRVGYTSRKSLIKLIGRR